LKIVKLHIYDINQLNHLLLLIKQSKQSCNWSYNFCIP